VLRGDGTDLELLEQERIEDSDVVVAVTSDDATNLLVSLLAKQLGIPKVITRVGRARNRRLFERVGIEAPLTPRTAAVQEVLNWLRLDEVDHLASIEDQAEVMEVTFPYRAEPGAVRQLGAPPNSLIGAIVRKNRAIVPHGDTVIQPGDHLFLITTPDNIAEVEAWLERHEQGRVA
jgi:trk system potassium uptake protein